MHLVNTSKERIEKTISVLQEYNIQKIGIAHCTGAIAVGSFSNAFQNRCFSCSADTQMSFVESCEYASVERE
jgi:7,8-dihydropterin-6-yl-methyl-4-(beta-D-ribofuranosyl)aminobenzene 5'-phosphate synthase